MAQPSDAIVHQPFNFSIESTGSGSTELIEGFFDSEDPDKIEIIGKEKPANPPKKEEKKEEPKKEEKAEEVKKPDLAKDLFGEEEEEVEEEQPKEEGDDEPVEENRFKALSTDLFRLGVFSKDEGEEDVEITSPEQFLERFHYEKKKGANEIVTNFIGNFGEDYQEAFEAIYVKGADPKEYWSTYSNIENLSELDITKEVNQEAIVRQALKDQGYDADSIQAKIEKHKQYADLAEEAAHAHKVLLKKEAQKLQDLEKAAEQKTLQKAQYKQQYLNNVRNTLESKLKTSEFDGIPINPKLAGEIQDFLVTERYKTPSGETLTEFDKVILDLKKPENHANKVKLALLLKILEKDPSLSTIQKTGVTKKTDALFQEVSRQSSKSPVKADKPQNQKASSWKNIL